MLVVALDTTGRAGSVAIVQDGLVVASQVGDPSRTHAERLPGDIVRVLEGAGLSLSDADVFAVAIGPGSFTGLRIGIATIQGLAFACSKPVVGVSTLEALATAVYLDLAVPRDAPVAVWIDAQRQEVFSAVFVCAHGADDGQVPGLGVLDAPAVAAPDVTLARWRHEPWFHDLRLVGDGTETYRHLLAGVPVPPDRILEPTPSLAPAIGRIAAVRAARGETVLPHAIKPLYVRRPDAELARDRKLAGIP